MFQNYKMIPINNDFEEETNETSQQVVDDETRSQYLMQSPSGSGDSTSINDININLNRFKTFKVNNKSKTTTNYKISNNNNTNYEHITGIY